ncbi:MAG: ABC transporter permease [Pseudomonadales bacterium]|nr:ABC transporter permease [Pseudomonadales bacterium]MCP5183431.1 ABC transporter permease [Pseudomonadales bacterium]
MPRGSENPFPDDDAATRGGWGRDHLRVIRDSAHFVSANLGTSLLVWLLVGIALALPAGLYLLERNLQDLSAAWDGRPGLSIYMDLGIDVAEVETLKTRLAAQAHVASVLVTLPDAALREFQAYSGLGDTLDMLSGNPLPASLRVILDSDAGASDLEALAALAGASPGVHEVVEEKTWLARVKDISTIVRRLSMVLAVLFGVGAVLVTASSVRLAIEARLEELRVQKLVGATDAQIRRPFLYFGAIYGAGGALVALMLISTTLLFIEGPLTSLFSSYGSELQLIGFDPAFLVVLLVLGGVLGVLGAVLSASQRIVALEIH